MDANGARWLVKGLCIVVAGVAGWLLSGAWLATLVVAALVCMVI